jgi:DNA-binding response OmpR family regulator
MNPVRILWADDQPDVQFTLATLLANISRDIVHVRDGNAAIDQLNGGAFDILILDLKMPPGQWGGLWLLREMRRLNLEIPTLVLSGEGTQTETIKALREGACDYVTKERAETELLQRLNEVLEKEGPSARLRRLIAIGESPHFECKETLRWNVNATKMDKNIEHAAAKTLAAFMNTAGGTLVVGVKDSGDVVGLGQDKFADRDAVLRHLDNVINTFLGNSSAPLAFARFVTLEAKEVLQIDCKLAESPVYLTTLASGEIEFYIRRQASSVKLKLDEAVAYIKQRFPSV